MSQVINLLYAKSDSGGNKTEHKPGKLPLRREKSPVNGIWCNNYQTVCHLFTVLINKKKAIIISLK